MLIASIVLPINKIYTAKMQTNKRIDRCCHCCLSVANEIDFYYFKQFSVKIIKAHRYSKIAVL